MAGSTESREFSRSSVRTRVEIRLATGVLVEGEARDVSLNGLLFETERALPIGHEAKISLILSGGSKEHRIETTGRVARIEARGVAFTFDRVDAESLEHLRQLVLFNADDVEQVEQEFSEHVGLRRKGN